ncbi:MAG: Fe(3+) ABC transporter substrate-binding protein [Robiginitomaculum sp.]|nr:MAG: Fe(3+) ABC transporter substrate-binding protein [Robiginitomaculum sp.]
MKIAYAVFALALIGCSPQSETLDTPTQSTETAPNTVQNAGVVNLYTSRHYDTDLALYSDFTKATGITVNKIEADADALIARIKAEGEYTPADVFITVDAGRLWRAEQADILKPITSEVLSNRVPTHFSHPDGLWYGISKRARVIIYNKAAGRPEGLNTYMDLAKPEFKNQICMRSSSNIYNISLLASIIGHVGSEGAQSWADGMVANFARKPQSNDTGHIKDVASGECKISLVNTYYIARVASATATDEKPILDQVGIIFPNEGDGENEYGTHVNISGAALVKHAPNSQNGIKFIEYLTSKDAQSYFANGNHEYPVVSNIAPTAIVTSLGAFTEDKINMAELGKNQKEAVQIFDKAGWQ